MLPQGGDLKPMRGKTLPLFTDPQVAANDLLKQAVQKMRTFIKGMDEGPYVLLYPNCSEVVHVPGTERPFKLAEYKKGIGKAYCRISLYICLERHFRQGLWSCLSLLNVLSTFYIMFFFSFLLSL